MEEYYANKESEKRTEAKRTSDIELRIANNASLCNNKYIIVLIVVKVLLHQNLHFVVAAIKRPTLIVLKSLCCRNVTHSACFSVEIGSTTAFFHSDSYMR